MLRPVVAACVAVGLLVFASTAAAAGGGLSLDQYKTTVSQAKYRDLLDRGLDIVAANDRPSGRTEVDLVLTAQQVSTLKADGVDVTLRRNGKGQSAREAAAAQMASGYKVWRDYDGADGFRAYLYDVAKRNPQVAKLEVIGHSGRGREILALKLTAGSRDTPDGTRPAIHSRACCVAL